MERGKKLRDYRIGCLNFSHNTCRVMGVKTNQRSSWTSATVTWSSSKTFDRHTRGVLRSSSHGHSADIAWRPCLARLHHRPYGNQRDSGVAWLLGAGWLPWWSDLDDVCVGLPWLAGAVWLPGAGRRWWDDERDVDLLDSGSGWIWQRSLPLWSQGHSLESKGKTQHNSAKIVNTSVHGSISRYCNQTENATGHTPPALLKVRGSAAVGSNTSFKSDPAFSAA